MDMPGFSEILPHVDEFDINGLSGFKVCTLEGLVLLKLIANDDTPSRIKDITDIEHIVLRNSENLHQRILSILNKRTTGELWQAMTDGMQDTWASDNLGQQ